MMGGVRSIGAGHPSGGVDEQRGHDRYSVSSWLAALPPSRACAAARDAALERGVRLVTTDFVADETLTLIRIRLGLPAAAAWWKQVNGSPRLQWERIDAARFEAGRDLFFRYRNKKFSFTDCTSFAVMRELRLANALTTDRHFSQMRFGVVPGTRRPKPPARG